MSTLLIRILALSSIAAFCTLCPNPIIAPAGADPPRPGFVEVWGDEFNGTTLDTNKWGHTRPGYARGGRIAIQRTDAVSVSGGRLVIRTYSDPPADPNDPDPPLMQHYTGMIQSGIATKNGQCQMPSDELVPTGNKYLPRYGYIEAKIDFDGASGMWHSFFVQTPNNLLAGPLDEHLRGMEMDIVEHKKMEGSTNVETQAPAAIHWMTGTSPSICYPNTPSFLSEGPGPLSGNGSLATGFHTYGLEWTPDYLKFYYDGNAVWRVNNTAPCPVGPPCVVAPVSHVPEILILCGEVPDPNFAAYGYIPVPFGYGVLGAASNPKMTVEYVRHYQLVAPGAVILSVPSVGQTTMAVSWNAPGADGYDGTATEYDLRYSYSPIDDASFGSATRVIIPAPATAGSPECQLLTGLSPSTTYYFALKTRDESGNWSEISNSPSGTTVTQNWVAECSEGNPVAKLPVMNDEAPQVFSAPRPNPARGETSFRIEVPRESQGANLRVGVYDVAGRRVRTLIDRPASPGPAQIQWNLRDNSGHRVASGIYMMRVEVGDTRKTFRLVVVR